MAVVRDAILIRRATSRDEPFLLEMLYEALFVAPGDTPFPRSVLDDPQIARYVRGYGRQGDAGLVAEASDGSPIGAAWVRRFTDGDQGYAYVDDDAPELSIAIVATHRRMGVGTELLTKLIAEVPRCSLSADRRNPAVRLYERLGFEIVERSGDSLTMVRDNRH